jgi:hypothetical protein
VGGAKIGGTASGILLFSVCHNFVSAALISLKPFYWNEHRRHLLGLGSAPTDVDPIGRAKVPNSRLQQSMRSGFDEQREDVCRVGNEISC